MSLCPLAGKVVRLGTHTSSPELTYFSRLALHFCTHTYVGFIHRTVADFLHNSGQYADLLSHHTISTSQIISSLIQANLAIVSSRILLPSQTDFNHVNIQSQEDFIALADLIHALENREGIAVARTAFEGCGDTIRQCFERCNVDLIKPDPSAFLPLLQALRKEHVFTSVMLAFYPGESTWIYDYITIDFTEAFSNLFWMPWRAIYQNDCTLKATVTHMIALCGRLLDLGANPSVAQPFTGSTRDTL